MEYPFLIDDALKAGKGSVSATTQSLLQQFAITEGANKEEFLAELQKKCASYYVFKRNLTHNEAHKCPTCGANIPVIAVNCSFCGTDMGNTIHLEYTDEEINAQIDDIVYKIRSIPKPSIFRAFMGNIYIIFPMLAVFIGVLSFGDDSLMQSLWQSPKGLPDATWLVVFEITKFISDNMFFFMPLFAGGGLLAILIKILMVFIRRKKSITLNTCRAEYERISNTIRIYYGNKHEFHDNLAYLQRNIMDYTIKKSRHSTFSGLIFAVFIGILSWYSTFFINYSIRDMSVDPNERYSDQILKTPEEYQKEHLKTHLKLKSLTASIKGPLSEYLSIDKGEYITYQIPGTYRENFYINNVQFTVKKPYKNTLDSGFEFQLYFSVVDEENRYLKYSDSSLILGFYLKDKDLLLKNMKMPDTKLILNFDGMISYREDSVPSDLQSRIAGFTVQSSISKKY